MNQVEIQAEAVAAPWVPQLEQYCLRVLTVLGRDNWELSVVICDQATMAEYNQQYRQKQGPTDVLSFPQVESVAEIPAAGLFLAGDIVISPDQVQENATEFAVSFDEELRRVCIHGILHLSGYDHATNEAHEPMLIEQERILKILEQEELHIV